MIGQKEKSNDHLAAAALKWLRHHLCIGIWRIFEKVWSGAEKQFLGKSDYLATPQSQH